MSRLMRSFFILLLSILISIILYNLSIRNPQLFSPSLTGSIIVFLAILNISANIFQVIGFLGQLLGKKKNNVSIERGKKLFTPILSNVKEIRKDLEDQKETPKIIDTSLWTEKSQSYLFLTSRKDAQDKTKAFYKDVKEFNCLLERLYGVIEKRISINMYNFSGQSGLVPPVNWNNEHLYGFDLEFNTHCNKEAKRLSSEVCRIILNCNEISPSHHLILANPFFNLLEEDDFLRLSITYKTKDDDELRRTALELANDFSESVYTSLIGEVVLLRVKEKKKGLITHTRKLIEFLEQEVRKTSK